MSKLNKKMDTMFFLTSEEGEEQKCIGCLFFTSKKYSGPIGYICPYTINHKTEDCRIAKNKLQKEVKPTVLTGLKGLKVSPFNELWNSKGVKVKPLIDQNNFVE